MMTTDGTECHPTYCLSRLVKEIFIRWGLLETESKSKGMWKFSFIFEVRTSLDDDWIRFVILNYLYLFRGEFQTFYGIERE